MSSFRIFDISGSALAAQSTRLSTVASNLANADNLSTRAEDTFKPKAPIFAVSPELGTEETPGVLVDRVVDTERPPVRRYEPGHPLADEEGYVFAPAVNVVEQMVDMISTARSYQSNVEVMNTAKDLALRTLSLGN